MKSTTILVFFVNCRPKPSSSWPDHSTTRVRHELSFSVPDWFLVSHPITKKKQEKQKKREKIPSHAINNSQSACIACTQPISFFPFFQTFYSPSPFQTRIVKKKADAISSIQASILTDLSYSSIKYVPVAVIRLLYLLGFCFVLFFSPWWWSCEKEREVCWASMYILYIPCPMSGAAILDGGQSGIGSWRHHIASVLRIVWIEPVLIGLEDSSQNVRRSAVLVQPMRTFDWSV